MKPDPLDQLLREAVGRGADPAPARQAGRAALGLALAWRERRDARARVVRTVLIAAALVIVLIAPLGSDDFETSVALKQKAGTEWKVFSQGLRGEEVWTSHQWTDAGLNDGSAEELLQQRAADAGVLVGMYGWQVGPDRHLTLVTEFLIDGHFVAESRPVPGQDEGIPAWLKAFVGPDHRAFFAEIERIRKSREPDLTMPMDLGGLQWAVKGWRIRLPGKEELIYYRGERADGVRSQDKEGF